MERLDKSRDVAVDRAEIDALTVTSTLGGADHARRPRYASLMNYYASPGNLPIIIVSVLPQTIRG